MSKIPFIDHKYVFPSLIGTAVIWLLVVVGMLLQLIINLNKTQTLKSLPQSPQQLAIQKALETIQSQTVSLSTAQLESASESGQNQ